MKYRLTTGADLAAESERRHLIGEVEDYIRKGDWQGPTIWWNMQESFHSWDRVVEIYTDYKAVPEAWPAEYNAQTDYWEIVPANHPDGEPSHTAREHVGSWCNETETKKHLRRLKEAQWRAQVILAMKELEKVKAPASVIASVQDRMFQYPAWTEA